MLGGHSSLDEKWALTPSSLAVYTSVCLAEVGGLFSAVEHTYGDEIPIKIATFGKAAVGKTATVTHLAGWDSQHKHVPTSGIQVLDCKWPIKLENGPIKVINTSFWDVGAVATTTFPYLRAEARLHADVILYMISPVDLGSYTLVEKQLQKDKDLPLVRIVIITKCDLLEKWIISEEQVQSLHDKYDIQICRIQNFPSTQEPFYEQLQVRRIMDLLSIAVIRKREIKQ